MKQNAGLVRRGVAFLVDGTILALVMIGLVALLHKNGIIPDYEIERIRLYHISWGFLKMLIIWCIFLSFLYGYLGELLPFRATIGKILMSIQVKNTYGEKSRPMEILTRNVVKQIPFLSFYFSFFFAPEVIFGNKFASLYSFETVLKSFVDLKGMFASLKQVDVMGILKLVCYLVVVVTFVFPLFGKKHRAIHDLLAGTVLELRQPREKKEKQPKQPKQPKQKKTKPEMGVQVINPSPVPGVQMVNQAQTVGMQMTNQMPVSGVQVTNQMPVSGVQVTNQMPVSGVQVTNQMPVSGVQVTNPTPVSGAQMVKQEQTNVPTMTQSFGNHNQQS